MNHDGSETVPDFCSIFQRAISCESYLPGTLVQYLVEAGKEGDGCNGRCQNITDRLGEKDAEALICREAGQDKISGISRMIFRRQASRRLTLA